MSSHSRVQDCLPELYTQICVHDYGDRAKGKWEYDPKEAPYPLISPNHKDFSSSASVKNSLGAVDEGKTHKICPNTTIELNFP